MFHSIQFTRSEFYLYSRTHLQKLEIPSVCRVKRSVYTQQCLAVYTSSASKNAGVQRVKTPVKTPLKWEKQRGRVTFECVGVHLG